MDMSCGRFHSLLLTNFGDVFSFGSNYLWFLTETYILICIKLYDQLLLSLFKITFDK